MRRALPAKSRTQEPPDNRHRARSGRAMWACSSALRLPSVIRRSVQLRCLEKPSSVAGKNANRQGIVVAHHLQHDFAAGRTTGPDLPPKTGKAGYRVVAHGQNTITRPQPGFARGTPLGETGNDDRVLDLCGIKAEPR